jgi:site-specific DNA-methyltransferase (cytosine-N4-specific)
MNLDISYEDYKKKLDIHGTVLYPAMMVAPVQRDVLKWLMDGRKGLRVLDPFQGAGTALYEAATITPDIILIGYDINPLASLITLVKLQGVDNQTIDSDIKNLEELIHRDFEFTPEPFYKSDKWFRSDIFYTLSKIKYAIQEISNKQNRQYFWIMLCDIIRYYSNTRSSTFKLHKKKQEKIDALKNAICKDYIKKVRVSLKFYKLNFRNFVLTKGNSLELINKIPASSVDIVVTSPPYGDNATTVTYGQFSYLPLSFIDKKDIPFEGWELNNCQILDSSSMGGTCSLDLKDEDRKYIQWYISRISSPKRKKVERFFADYFNFLDSACRVSKEYIDLTLGNRTVDRVRINLSRITVRYLQDQGFVHIRTLSRSIVLKRTPDQILVNGIKTTTMTKEYIVIMKKVEAKITNDICS